MGSTTNINATINHIPASNSQQTPDAHAWKILNFQRLEGKHTALQIALDLGCVCNTRVAQIA
jgi:hypothetical protein